MAKKKQETIFTELRYAIKLVKADMKSKEPAYSKMNIYAIKKLNNFIMSGEWSNAKSVEKLLLYINLSSTEAAEKTEQAMSTVRTQRANASKLIKCLLGSDCIECCLSSDTQRINSALNRIEVLQALNKSVNDYISNDITERFRNIKHEDYYDLEECEKEIKVLAELSALHKENLLNGVDNEKMSYLISVLLQPKVLGENKEPNVDLADLIQMIEQEERQIRELVTQNNRLKQVVELYEENESKEQSKSTDEQVFGATDLSDDDLFDDSFLKGDDN